MPNAETAEAGALWGLYYALYYAPDAGTVFKNLPNSVIKAYTEVQEILRLKEQAHA